MFTEYDTGERELYDLRADPYQLQSKPRTGNEQLYSTLESHLNDLRACSGEACRSAEWDTTPPRVTSTSPAANATGVDPATDVTATFSEKMDPASIKGTTFKLFKCSSTTSTTCTTQITNVTVSLSADGLRATLNPFGTSSTLLAPRTKYKAVVTTGAKDLAGNALDQNATTSGNQQKVWFFTVRN